MRTCMPGRLFMGGVAGRKADLPPASEAPACMTLLLHETWQVAVQSVTISCVLMHEQSCHAACARRLLSVHVIADMGTSAD